MRLKKTFKGPFRHTTGERVTQPQQTYIRYNIALQVKAKGKWSQKDKYRRESTAPEMAAIWGSLPFLYTQFHNYVLGLLKAPHSIPFLSFAPALLP